MKRGKHVKSAEELKQEFAIVFCVNDAPERIIEPVVILKGKFSDILSELQDQSQSTNVPHFPSQQLFVIFWLRTN